VLERARDQAIEVAPARRIRIEKEPAVAEQLLRRRSAFARIATDVADDDERALVREAQRDRAPESRSGAGDDRDSGHETLPRRHSRRCAQLLIEISPR
jgi:hypothetical protein